MAITSKSDIFAKMHSGNGLFAQYDGLLSGSTTGASANSGNHTIQLILNTLGSSQWGTLVGTNIQAGLTSPIRLTFIANASSRATTHIYARLYKIGTLNLATSSSEFTHDAATFPILRTQMGASSAIDLIPLMLITTAPSVTAPVFTMNYVDQDGNATTGTKSFTLPSATAAAGSCFIIPLEEGDSAIRDITDIAITTPGSSGAADLYGMEILGVASTALVHSVTNKDSVLRGISLPNLTPGTATSGTASSLAVFVQMGQSATTTLNAMIQGYYDS